MNDLHQNSLARWEDLLRDTAAIRMAQELADGIVDPATASTEECWEKIWSKPLFANMRVEGGEKAAAKLRPFMADAWRDWGCMSGRIIITHNGSTNKRENFSVTGSGAAEIDQLGIARHRLLAIQGGANLLRSLVQEDPNHPFQPLVALDRKGMVDRIRSGAGRGWGPITTLHLLTEFGLAIKPDLHVVNTVNALNLLPGLRSDKVPSLKNALAIIDAVDKLGKQLFGNDYGPRKRRYLDKILMELSRQNLLDEIGNKDIA